MYVPDTKGARKSLEDSSRRATHFISYFREHSGSCGQLGCSRGRGWKQGEEMGDFYISFCRKGNNSSFGCMSREGEKSSDWECI